MGTIQNKFLSRAALGPGCMASLYIKKTACPYIVTSRVPLSYLNHQTNLHQFLYRYQHQLGEGS